MSYDINGKFFEACDCEVICSCWNEIEPVMGQCTGMFVWKLGAGSTVDGLDVAGHKLATISHGPSCDDGDQMLVVIDTGETAQTDPLFTAIAGAFLSAGPWNQVFDFPPGAVPPVVLGQITFAETPGATRVTVGPVVAGQGSHTVEAAANGVFNSHIKLDGSSAAPRTKIPRPANNLPLIQRVPGSEEPIIEVGHVELAADGIGLSILADLYADPAGADPAYRFDLDLTTVTAMRGEFKYTLK